MKKSKWLGAFLVGAMALLGSNLARADLYISSELTSVGYLVKFLTAGAEAGYAVVTLDGNSFSYDSSSNVVVTPGSSSDLIVATLSSGTAALSDGSYGWLTLTPSAGSTMALTIAGSNLEVTALPEPGTYALIGLGVAGLLLARRRQKKSEMALGQFAV